MGTVCCCANSHEKRCPYFIPDYEVSFGFVMIMVAMITVPASEIDMNDNVPLTITITDALSPYSNHSAFLWDILLVFPFSPVVIWLTSSFVSSPAWAPTRWHAHLSRAASGAFDAPTSLIRSLWRAQRRVGRHGGCGSGKRSNSVGRHLSLAPWRQVARNVVSPLRGELFEPNGKVALGTTRSSVCLHSNIDI